MKSCLVCRAVDSDDARHTCLGCGNADWARVAAPAEPPPADDAPVSADPETPAPMKKRGNR